MFEDAVILYRIAELIIKVTFENVEEVKELAMWKLGRETF